MGKQGSRVGDELEKIDSSMRSDLSLRNNPFNAAVGTKTENVDAKDGVKNGSQKMHRA